MIPRLPSEPETASLHAAFCAELRARGFSGDLSLAASDRTVLATDNSIYQLTPQAIAFPRERDDLVRIAKLLSEERFAEIRIAPRGGGTGTNGQSLTDGLLVDLSRYMTRILAIDPARRTVRVEAGVVKDQLNATLKPLGLFFAPSFRPRTAVLPSDCGGMAGTYGHEAENRATSARIYGLSWSKPVAEKGRTGRLLADGYSCRSQAKIIDGVRLPHPVEILRDHLATSIPAPRLGPARHLDTI
ncbi:FAD-binding protein [Methylobacterium currus]|uniref:FAD-binding oxidoreductase n=1 Tax=Methylobacterium currus TaxID=2051553 RepID=UPI001E62F20A|nr:FAD-binding oxidoreductase [Methylobacterium currus]UHC19159.1 FAD-binding protein [Methylobacterium currus]